MQEHSWIRVEAEQEQGRSRMMKAAKLGWAEARAGEEQDPERSIGNATLHCRSKVGAGQEQGRGRAGAAQE